MRLGETRSPICTNIVLFTWQAKTWSKLPPPPCRHQHSEKAQACRTGNHAYLDLTRLSKTPVNVQAHRCRQQCSECSVAAATTVRIAHARSPIARGFTCRVVSLSQQRRSTPAAGAVQHRAPRSQQQHILVAACARRRARVHGAGPAAAGGERRAPCQRPRRRPGSVRPLIASALSWMRMSSL